MARGHHIPKESREYVQAHYQRRGAVHCANKTKLTVAQVWGLAARLDVNQRRTNPVRSTPIRLADNGHRGVPNSRAYQASDLEVALRHWSATRKPWPAELLSLV